MSEKCDRCGSVGEDRRTLWMACFYAMDEMPVPFGKKLVFHPTGEKEEIDIDIVEDAVQFEAPDGFKVNLSPPVVKVNEPMVPRELFTLRVCKRCRGEWMRAIGGWYQAEPEGEDHDADNPVGGGTGSGIFIRENGAIREISEEEWYERNPGREPIRVRPGSETIDVGVEDE